MINNERIRTQLYMENEAYIILELFFFFFWIEHPGLEPKPLVTHQVVVDHCCCCCCWKQLTSHCLCCVARNQILKPLVTWQIEIVHMILCSPHGFRSDNNFINHRFYQIFGRSRTRDCYYNTLSKAKGPWYPYKLQGLAKLINQPMIDPVY